MKKKFNITGVCYPHLHYMMDNSQKIREVMEMVEYGEYFVINRPRQYGKTTTIQLLNEQLKQSVDYLSIRMNFQGMDSKWLQSDEVFAEMFLTKLIYSLEFYPLDLASFLEKERVLVSDMGTLSTFITRLVHETNRKLVLIIDEVDASSNYEAFLSFLAMLRNKFLERFSPHQATFHSIVLAGVHDIKSLKSKIRDTSSNQYNSPWNIATDFLVRMSFNPAEIAPMLEEYSEAEGVSIGIPLFSEKLYYHTQGYPFLVSKLCKTIAERILPHKEKKCWTLDDLETSIQLLLKENNTNFDSLIKNLENNAELYQLVYRVLIDGENIPFNPDEPLIHLGRMYGIFTSNGRLKIHNRIYEQRIYNYMTVKAIVNFPLRHNYAGHFLLDNHELDMTAVLLKFQEFMKEEESRQNQDFLETQGRLIFLAYLAPILNGQGHSFKEVQTSQEKRLDVVVTYFQHKYIIELKRWYGPKAHGKGLDQLAEYLDHQGVDAGYLVIFDGRKQKGWKQERISHQGKDIFAIWV